MNAPDKQGEWSWNGKVLGRYRGDTYFTDRDSIRHFYRKQQGYPMSVKLLEWLKVNGVKKIRIFEHGREDHNLHVYEVYVHDYDNIEAFQENPYKAMTDWQKCIPLRRMTLVHVVSEVSL